MYKYIYIFIYDKYTCKRVHINVSQHAPMCICLYAYMEEAEKRGESMAQILMPQCLDDPHHWGYLAWKYIDFCNDQQTEETWREINFLSQA